MTRRNATAAVIGTATISGRNNDAYSPPKIVEQTKKLIESDEVAFAFRADPK